MKYVNQAPKEFDKMCAAFKKKHTCLGYLPASNYIIQPKYDGVFAMIFTSDRRALTRQGETILSVDHLVGLVADKVGPGYVVFGELWETGKKHAEINGDVRRHSPSRNLHFVAFDVVPALDFANGTCPTPYRHRRQQLVLSDLWVANTIATGGMIAQYLANELAQEESNAYDGTVAWDLDAPWSAGACKNGETIKVKFKQSYDLRVVGEHAEQQATKLGGHLTVELNGVQSKVGSGLTQAMLENIILAGGLGCDKTSYYKGKVAEIECLGLTPTGKLREPRFKGFRFDTVREEDKE